MAENLIVTRQPESQNILLTEIMTAFQIDLFYMLQNIYIMQAFSDLLVKATKTYLLGSQNDCRCSSNELMKTIAGTQDEIADSCVTSMTPHPP